jgi:uncharacterized membrane protein
MTDTSIGRGPGHIDMGSETARDGDARTMLLVIYGLYFAGFITSGVTTLVGVILAYVGRGSGPAWAQSHYSFQIRTFWLTLLAFAAIAGFAVLSVILSLVLVGLLGLLLLAPMGLALMVWFGVRCGVGFNHALNSRAYPDPATLLI